MDVGVHNPIARETSVVMGACQFGYGAHERGRIIQRIGAVELHAVLGREMIPVLAPVATSASGGTFNVNADTFAGAIAGALKAKRLLLLTDVPGVLDKSKTLIEDLSA